MIPCQYLPTRMGEIAVTVFPIVIQSFIIDYPFIAFLLSYIDSSGIQISYTSIHVQYSST
jgi:hypothetical protein